MNTQIFPRTESQQMELKAESAALQSAWTSASLYYEYAAAAEKVPELKAGFSQRAELAHRAACTLRDQNLDRPAFIIPIEGQSSYALQQCADGAVVARHLDLIPSRAAAARLNATMAEQVRVLLTANQDLMAKVLIGVKPQESITWKQVTPGKWVAELENDTRAVVYDGAPSDNVTELRFEAHDAVGPTTAAVFLSAEDARAQMIPFFVRWRIHCRAMKSFAARNWQAIETTGEGS